MIQWWLASTNKEKGILIELLSFSEMGRTRSNRNWSQLMQSKNKTQIFGRTMNCPKILPQDRVDFSLTFRSFNAPTSRHEVEITGAHCPACTVQRDRLGEHENPELHVCACLKEKALLGLHILIPSMPSTALLGKTGEGVCMPCLSLHNICFLLASSTYRSLGEEISEISWEVDRHQWFLSVL